MNGVHHLCGLFDQRQGRSDRNIGPALPDTQFRRVPEALAGLCDALNEPQGRCVRPFVRQSHDCGANRLFPGLNSLSLAGRQAEIHGILPPHGLRIEESGEIGEHCRVQHLPPRRCERLIGVSEDVEKTD